MAHSGRQVETCLASTAMGSAIHLGTQRKQVGALILGVHIGVHLIEQDLTLL